MRELRTAFQVAGLVLLAACGHDHTSDGPYVPDDLLVRTDLVVMPTDASPPDLVVIADQAVAPDTALPPDLAMPDLSTPDLTLPPDLLAAPDLFAVPDLALPPDLRLPDFSLPDFSLPDLTQPDLVVLDVGPLGDLTAATCTDGIKNGNETDVDCGGGTCPSCNAGQGCKVNGDCKPLLCGSANTCRYPASCNELHVVFPALPSGVYTINPVSQGAREPPPPNMRVGVNVYCDMVNDGGGWTRVVNIRHDSLLHGDTTVAAGDVSDATAAAKLADDTINQLNSIGYFRYNCGTTYNAFVKNTQNTWTSLKHNSNNWSTDRTRTGNFTCPANRDQYVFSDYNNGAGPCNANNHTDYAAAAGAAEGYGCYNAMEGWNKDGNLWAK